MAYVAGDAPGNGQFSTDKVVSISDIREVERKIAGETGLNPVRVHVTFWCKFE
jgi:hypothetical protein